MRILLSALTIPLVIGCSNSAVTNTNHNNLIFTEIKSDYKITDKNSYDCKKINNSII